MIEETWTKISRTEWKVLARKAKALLNTMSNTSGICDPPVSFLIEDTGKGDARNERWLLKVSMDWEGPNGEKPKYKEEFWDYYKSDALEKALKKL